jgi:dethiobiotin synthetase
MPALFVTGTDTEVGKTYLAAGLVRALRARACGAVGYKPVATGVVATAAGLRNADAEALLAASGPGFRYAEVNPFVFAPATIPHVAARAAGVALDLDRLQAGYAEIARRAQWVIVEGAGGWRVPLADRAHIADLAARIGASVILVVGVRLGCISHALLTAEAIRRDGCKLRGWVANEIDHRFADGANAIDSISERIGKPPLARLRFAATRANGLQLARLAEFVLQAHARLG